MRYWPESRAQAARTVSYRTAMAWSWVFAAIYNKRWTGHHFRIVYTTFGDNGVSFCCYLLGLVSTHSCFAAIYTTWWTWFHILLLFIRVGDHWTWKTSKTTVKTAVFARFHTFCTPRKSFISLLWAMKWMILGSAKNHENIRKHLFLLLFCWLLLFDEHEPLQIVAKNETTFTKSCK